MVSRVSLLLLGVASAALAICLVALLGADGREGGRTPAIVGWASAAPRLGEAGEVTRRHSGVTTRFQRRGAVVATSQGAVRLSVAAVGRSGSMTRVAAGRRSVGRVAVTYHRGETLERFGRGEVGLEHRVTIKRPPGGAGPVAVQMHAAGVRRAWDSGRSLVLRPERGEGVRYTSVGAWDANGRELETNVEAGDAGPVVHVTDTAAEYPVSVEHVVQRDTLLAPPSVGLDGGRTWRIALSADGQTAVVGDPGAERLAGRVWVFAQVQGAWVQRATLAASDAMGPAMFGSSVAVSADGTTVLVGGMNDHGAYSPHAGQDGAAWVFVRNGDTWSQQGPKLRPSDADGAAAGTSVALSADGATAFVAGSGVWAFSRDGEAWRQQGQGFATSDGGSAASLSQVAVSADGATVVAGAPLENDMAGTARVFGRDGDAWRQQSRLPGAEPSSRFGSTVAISGDGQTVVVGELSRARPFTRDGDGWAAGDPIERPHPDPASTGAFPTGIAISEDGGTVALGDSDGQHLSAWVLRDQGDGWRPIADEVTPGGPLERVGDVAVSADSETVVVDGQAYETAEVAP